ncbi:S-adenosyl-L-methionine-dependent methyltransferase [Trametes sanguinea]|nr:S-adenosyl-L-methionine-dependent methyltransferase [Trametes sanguinea]
MAVAYSNDHYGDQKYFGPLQELVGKEKEKGWDEAWKTKLTPWDAGTFQPALQELVESGAVNLPKSGRALVPGCGRGYDAVYIARSLGLDTLGADISAKAVQAAKDYKNAIGGPDNVRFEVTDFFAMDTPAAFDLAYDYTFFIAIPPALRPAWGKQMTKLVKPGGFLITLVFPIEEEYTDAGPPFFVRPEHYAEVLGAGTNWEKVWDAVPAKTLDTHVGKERLVVWRRL